MFDWRYEFAGTLDVLSPLHVGTGDVAAIAGVGGRAGSNEPLPGVALIVRDDRGYPWLPPTTLKGLLRRIGEDILPDDQVKDLFGSIKLSENQSGAMGALLPRGATLQGSAPDVTGYPYVKAAGGALKHGTFVAARTAIDARAGVADDHKLYFQEMVPAGAAFAMRFTLLARDDKPARLDALRAILAVLARDNGVPCGRGKADGAGALRLRADKLTQVEKRIDGQGELVAAKSITVLLPRSAAKPKQGAAPAKRRWRGTLVCDGPFISIDSSHDPNAGRTSEDDKSVPQLVYQRGSEGQPLELGSQVSGVLRARARWIAGLEALKNGLDPITVDPGAADDLRARQRVVQRPADVGKIGLTPVERLFGVSGFAGLLAIEKMRFSDAKPYSITSVKLDHFSGAPIDKALFTTSAVTGARLDLVLTLRDRRGVGRMTQAGIATEQDCRLFKALMDDLKVNGLSLGHGWAKGFGWFTLKNGQFDDE
jgi:CRISPR/Cas system CSM-associated protein Csm3 (group 7 of RAMP superfamily)